MLRFVWLIPILLFIQLSSFAHAAPQVRSPGPGLVHNKLIELRGRLLREMVGLTAARAKEVEAILVTFDEHHRTYSERLESARRTMHRLVSAKSNDAPALASAVENVRLAHDQLHRLRDRQFRAMQNALTPQEQALFFTSLGKLRREVKRRLVPRVSTPGTLQ